MDHEKLPLTSTHWGAYRVETEGDRVTALHPFAQDADPSPIGAGMVGLLEAPSRITAPMVRQSWLDQGPGAATARRGADPFVEVSWTKAETLVAAELARLRAQFGNSAIFGGSYGWASAGRFHHATSQLHRFLNCIGGYTRSVDTYSFAAAEVIVPHILGEFRPHLIATTSWQSIASQSGLFVAFGGVPLKNGQINNGGLGSHEQRAGVLAAARAGVDFVSLSPLRSDMDAALNADWIAPRPGTDTAIMLGLAHCLIAADQVDHAFLDRYTVGYARFRDYVTGARDGVAKTAEWAADISDIPADSIRDLARRMASSRTMISVSWSLTRQDHGEQPYWAAIALAAMLGQIGLEGGGIGFGYGAINSIGAQYQPFPAGALPVGQNPVADFIPVARITDALLNPGGAFSYNGQAHRYPDIRCIYWTGGNPFHHHQDLNRLLRGWARAETVIVHDWCWNATARHADIVLPCTTHLERSDLGISARDGYLIAMEAAVPPVGQARNDYDIFAGIAGRMGHADSFTEGRDAEDWQRWIYDLTRQRCAQVGIELPGLAELRAKGWHEADPPTQNTVMLRDFRTDPLANPLKTPSGKIEIYSETLAGFGLTDCGGHPTWFPPKEWPGDADTRHPLQLISNQPATKLHSQLDHGTHSRAAKINGREPCHLHPEDAAARGIAAGDILRVFNDRGAWYDPKEPGQPASLCKH